MKDNKAIETKIIDKNIVSTTYKLGYCTFVVNSYFTGKEKVKDLMFRIIKDTKTEGK